MACREAASKTHDTASSLIVVGSIALDTVSTPGAHDRIGLGGSATYFSAAAGLLCCPEVIAVLGDDFDRTQLNFLVERGVDLSSVYTKQGKTFQWQGTYGDDLAEATTLRTDLNVFADFEPNLSDRQKNCDFLFLANIIPHLQLKVVEQAKAKFVAADTMNLWINTANADLKRVLSMIDMLVLNEAEPVVWAANGCHQARRGWRIYDTQRCDFFVPSVPDDGNDRSNGVWRYVCRWFDWDARAPWRSQRRDTSRRYRCGDCFGEFYDRGL